MQEQRKEQIDTETTVIASFDEYNLYQGEHSEHFLKALRSNETTQCLFLLGKNEVRVIDDRTIVRWMSNMRDYKEAYEQMALNETAMKEQIAELQADLAAVMTPLAALRPALLGAIKYFEEQKVNPKKESVIWKTVRAGAKMLVKNISTAGGKGEVKRLTKEEKDSAQKKTEFFISGAISLIKFGQEQSKNLEKVFEGINLMPAYNVICKHELIAQDQVQRIETFIKTEMQTIIPQAENGA